MQAGDWMNYTVDVATAGTYTFDARTYYWGSVGGTFHVEFDGVDKTGALQMPGGNTWGRVSKAGVQLTAGRHVMRVVCDSNAPGDSYLGDIDSMKLLPAEARPGNGLTGEYFDNVNFTGYSMTRADAMINFDWADGSPSSSMGVDDFSVRWTGTVVPRYSEAYTFYTTTDDGVRVWIDWQLIIDKWVDQAPTEWTGQLTMEAGRAYAIRVEFYERGGGAMAWLKWSSAS
jgi:PA14 domain